MTKILNFFIGTLVIICLSAFGAYLYIDSELTYLKIFVPSCDNIVNYNDEIKTVVYGKDGETEIEMYKKYYRHSKKIPNNYDMSKLIFLTDRLIEYKYRNLASGEMERWKHILIKSRGIDPFTLRGAALNHYADKALKDNNISGLRGEIVRWYTLKRLKEKYSGDILYRMFLDEPPYGENIYGIAAACEYYLGKTIEEANLLELSFLAAILSDDKFNNISESYSYLDKYARAALRELYESGKITKKEYNLSSEASVNIAPPPSYPIIEPSYTSEVFKMIANDGRFHEGMETIKIYTGYNKHSSDIVRKVVLQYLEGKDKSLQIAFVLANRETRSIEAAVGGRKYEDTKNRAFYIKRPMASTFKPIVYLTAFNRGILPSSHIVDKPYDFKSGKTVYSPKNYEDYFMGNIPIRYGLIYSLNNATIKLAEITGLEHVKNMALNIGMKGDIYAFHAMAIGAFPATPINSAQIYSTIGNYGIYSPPSLILKIETGSGNVYDMREEPKRVVSESAAFQTLYIMQEIPRRGTARGKGLLPGTAAKTGTSNDYRDAWTVALFDKYVAVCWVGYDNNRTIGDDMSGGRVAAPVVALFQKEFFESGTKFNFKAPDSIEFVRVSKYNGYKTDKEGNASYIEAFNKEKLPPEGK